MTANPPTLPGDLDRGLRRLRLGAMRQLAPELLVTAKTQRWAPEEFLRTLLETEIAPEYRGPGTWMHDALEVRDDWQSQLLRTSGWSPLS